MDDKDGPSPPPDLSSRSSGGTSLSLEEKFSLMMDKMERQSEQLEKMASVLEETQRQSAEAKESKYLFYKFLSVLFVSISYIF